MIWSIFKRINKLEELAEVTANSFVLQSKKIAAMQEKIDNSIMHQNMQISEIAKQTGNLGKNVVTALKTQDTSLKKSEPVKNQLPLSKDKERMRAYKREWRKNKNERLKLEKEKEALKQKEELRRQRILASKRKYYQKMKARKAEMQTTEKVI
jgi:hypothetical protein